MLIIYSRTFLQKPKADLDRKIYCFGLIILECFAMSQNMHKNCIRDKKVHFMLAIRRHGSFNLLSDYLFFKLISKIRIIT